MHRLPRWQADHLRWVLTIYAIVRSRSPPLLLSCYIYIDKYTHLYTSLTCIHHCANIYIPTCVSVYPNRIRPQWKGVGYVPFAVYAVTGPGGGVADSDRGYQLHVYSIIDTYGLSFISP